MINKQIGHSPVHITRIHKTLLLWGNSERNWFWAADTASMDQNNVCMISIWLENELKGDAWVTIQKSASCSGPLPNYLTSRSECQKVKFQQREPNVLIHIYWTREEMRDGQINLCYKHVSWFDFALCATGLSDLTPSYKYSSGSDCINNFSI